MPGRFLSRPKSNWRAACGLAAVFLLLWQPGLFAQTLTHRYSFWNEPNGSTVATDVIGGANGTLQGGALISGGQLALNGASGTYLNLPAGIINSSYPAATIETWVSFRALPVNCFFYGFGNTDSGGAGEDYLFCAPQGGRIAITGTDPGYTGEQNARTGVDWSGYTNVHLAAVYNPPAGTVAVYTNGILAAINTSATTPISAVNDVYSYIGRSLYTSDPYAPLSVAEFRVWNGALSAQRIALDAASGPTQIITSPGALLSVGVSANRQMRAGATQQAVVTGAFANVANVNLITYGQATVASDNTNVLTVSPSGLVTAFAPGTADIIGTYNGLSATQTVTVAGFVTNRFVFDTFGDGFWAIVNQGNSNVLTASFGGASQETFASGAAEQQFELLYNLQNGTFRIRQHSSWLCLGAQNNIPKPGGAVTLTPFYTGAAAQQWYFVDAGGGCFRIFNAASNLVLQTDNGTPANVTLAAPSGSRLQLWQFAYQTHYPKKGTGGWVGQYGTSWGYDWGYNGFSPSSLPAQVVYEPMQWGNWNVDTSTYGAWHSTPKPIYLLGFNEPDNKSQANMTVGQAINLWPQLQAMNVPLVSPAVQNTFDSWEYSFFDAVATNHYRVDYTAVHWYANPNATSLINTLHSVYATWGRPVWLTEFSPVDWSGTATWSEDDNYNFLAEFLWMAEDQDWLKRYAIFLFSGVPSANPWDPDGHRGDFFDSTTGQLTPYGELYASWDADRTLRARTPYFIHNLGTSFRLTSTNSPSGLAPSSIRVRDVTTQWALLPAPTTNHWYIISLRDGRRLNDSVGALSLAQPGTTGPGVEWTFTGPDSKGYYFIGNPFWRHNLNGSGTPPAITFSTVSSTTQNNNTRWRLIKPYRPVAIPSPITPTGLSANAGGGTVTLTWTAADRFYNVYRGTVSGGPYTKMASVLGNNSFADGGVSDGTRYYYVVTGLNILGEESGDSAEASALPVSMTSPQLAFGVGSNALQFNWPPDHTGWELQVQTNPPGRGLGDAWVTVPGSSATNLLSFPMDGTNGSVFFRLVYP